jgi:hypothetical protein
MTLVQTPWHVALPAFAVGSGDLAGNDLTARSSCTHATSPSWRGVSMTPDRRVDVAESDHTFSCHAWRRQVEDATLDWLRSFSA